MSIEQEVSDKLRWPKFEKSVDKEPLQCFYQLLSNDSYTSSGYSFYVKSPGQGILMDPDIWIKYMFTLTDTGGNNALGNNFNTAAAANDVYGNIYAASNNRIAFRGGNFFQRATQNITAIINGHSITCEPWKFVDILNRLYISDDQSRHEFSASGGKFDNGNHALRTLSDISAVGAGTGNVSAAALIGGNVISGFHTDAAIQTNGIAATNTINFVSPAPNIDYFYNQGYNDRCMKFADMVRRHQAPNAIVSLQYGANGINNPYTFTVYERLPLPPFKMYSNDEIYGMIPNIKDLTIRGQFTSNLVPNLMRATSAANYTLALDGTPAGCQLLIKWFTPPPDMSIPMSVSIPLRKINVWSATQTIAALGAADNGVAITPGVSQYNISLDAVPDLLLLYFRYRVDSVLINYPDDYNMEMYDLQINIEGASGKLNQIQTIQLYQNWKKLLKHQDPNITPYDEWRRYMCVAALLPSDYGCINGPGYSNPITLGVTCSLRNWWNIPKMGLIPEELYAGTACEFVVTSIFDKWSLTINSSGSAQSQLERVAPSNYASPSSIGLSQLNPQPIGLRNIM